MLIFAQPEGFDRLEALAQSLAPEGAWTATYQASGAQASGHWQVSYDAASECFSLVSPGTVVGRELSGKRYEIIGGGLSAPVTIHSDILTVSDHPTPGDSKALDLFFPSLVLAHLARDPACVRHVESLPEGLLRVTATWPGGSRDQQRTHSRVPPLPEQEVVFVFDLQGRMVRREHGPALGNLSWVFEYDDRSPAGFAIPARITMTSARGGTIQTLASLTPIPPDRLRSAFDAVAQRDAAISASRQPLLVQPGGDIAAKFHAPPATPPTTPPAPTLPHPKTSSPMARYRWPLVGTGLVVLPIAAGASIKRARA